MEVPNVKRTEWTLVDINEDGFVTIMDDSGETREDLKIPEGEAGDDIRKKFENLEGDAALLVSLYLLTSTWCINALYMCLTLFVIF